MNEHITIRRPIESDIEYISEHIRDADKLEVESFGVGVYAIMKATYDCDLADNYTALYDGVPMAMFGIHKESLIGVTATIWMLGTSDVGKCPRELITKAREVISNGLLENMELMNYIDCRYKKTLRWLKHLGFSYSEPFKLGINGEEFVKASIRR